MLCGELLLNCSHIACFENFMLCFDKDQLLETSSLLAVIIKTIHFIGTVVLLYHAWMFEM